MTDDEALAEIRWVARESRALAAESVQPDSTRWAAYLDRKRAVLAHVERRTRR